MNSTISAPTAACACVLALRPASCGQVTLSGTSYSQDFNTVGSSLPPGWTVSTNATLSTLGTDAIFAIAATSWASPTAGTAFRNISSSDIAYNSSAAVQLSAAARWFRDGAVTLALADTLNLTNFSLGLAVFQSNDVAPSGGEVQTYQLEYRVGSSGDFTAIGSPFVTNFSGLSNFLSITYSISGSALDLIANQSGPVYVRLRGGLSTSASGNLDTIGLDNFSLSYTAIPEPATYAALFGVLALGSATWRRRMTAA
jgi:PEP-CTERM motif